MGLHQPEILIASAFAGVAVAAFGAYWNFGDREESLRRSLQGSKSLLEDLGGRLTMALQQRISAVLSEKSCSPILGPDGSYSERPANPADSESFREELKKFLESSSEPVVEYCTAVRAVRDWSERATRLSWALLALAAWYGLAAAAFFVCAVTGSQLPLWLFLAACLLSGPPLLYAVSTFAVMQRRRDALVRLRGKYGCP